MKGPLGSVGEHEPMAEINITPLTDVFLVLLIIFMVSAPMIMTAGIKIKMPQTKALPALTERDIVVKVTSDERYFVNDVETPKRRLQEYLKDLKLEGKLVVVEADQTLSHGLVVGVLDIAKMAGAEKLAIATNPVVTKKSGKKKSSKKK